MQKLMQITLIMFVTIVSLQKFLPRCEVKEFGKEVIARRMLQSGLPGSSTCSKSPIIEPGLPACSQKNRISFQARSANDLNQMKISSETNSTIFKVTEFFCASTDQHLHVKGSTLFSLAIILDGIGQMKGTNVLNSKVRRDATSVLL